MLERKNYYDVLEISINANQEDIQKSYTRSKNAYSGDSVAMYSLLSTQESEKILEEVEEAYSILSVPEKRREYDRIRGLQDPSDLRNKIHQENTITEMAQARVQIAKEPNMETTTKPTPNTRDLKVDEMFNYSGPNKSENFQFSETSARENVYEEARSHQDVLKFENESTKSNVQVAKFSALAKYQLDYEFNQEIEDKIDNCEEFTGLFLQEIREYKKVTIERLADMTKISKMHLRNLENDDFEKLPAYVYTRGFVFQIAKALKLNADLVCNTFMHHRKKTLNSIEIIND